MQTERRRYHSFIDDSARWDRVALRADDIIITTPAKSGTTWMQMCCGLLIFQAPVLPAPLAVLSPWVDMLTWPIDEVVALLDAQTHRRFMKTHTPLDGLPWDPSVTYICVARDPRDATLSMENHMANMDLEAVLAARERAVGLDDIDLNGLEPPTADRVAQFWQWVGNPGGHEERAPGLAVLLEQLQTYWDRRDEPNVALFHYADLQADLEGQMRRLAGVLGIDVPDERWPALVHAATFEEMKANADRLAPDTEHKIWRDNRQFFDRGTSGRWRDVVGEADVERYDRRVAELVAPDLAAWAHHGWLGTVHGSGDATTADPRS
jgi:aryl sulfotransferase